MAIYYRKESPTQTVADAKKQEETGEFWGQSKAWNAIIKVRAYDGPLPPGERGVEFETDILPDPGQSPGQPTWGATGPRPGVVIEDGWAKIKGRVLKNTQR